MLGGGFGSSAWGSGWPTQSFGAPMGFGTSTQFGAPTSFPAFSSAPSPFAAPATQAPSTFSGPATWSTETKSISLESVPKASAPPAFVSKTGIVIPAVKNKAEGILDSVVDAVGCTPLIRLNKIMAAEGLECEVLAKCEFYNPGGSVKDRIGRAMILAAEESGRIKPGEDCLVEPTSGNTGVGLAMVGAARGYDVTITMPMKMSKEKSDTLGTLGARVIRTPTEAAFDAFESHISLANRMVAADPTGHTHCLDQYTNPANPGAHYQGTADEIIAQTGGKVDLVVVAAGTGGTLAGISKRIKEVLPDTKICGVDPVGSILAGDGGGVGAYEVEGIGYDFIPKVLEGASVDFWVRTTDPEAFRLARRLHSMEGLLGGGSCGSALAGTVKAVKQLGFGKGKRVVVILADGVRNYMTKFLSDDWLTAKGFPTEPWSPRTEAGRMHAASPTK